MPLVLNVFKESLIKSVFLQQFKVANAKLIFEPNLKTYPPSLN